MIESGEFPVILSKGTQLVQNRHLTPAINGDSTQHPNHLRALSRVVAVGVPLFCLPRLSQRAYNHNRDVFGKGYNLLSTTISA